MDPRSDDSGDRERLRQLVCSVPFFPPPFWSLSLYVFVQEDLLDVGVPPSEEDGRTDFHGNGMFLRRLALLMQHRVELRARWSSSVWEEMWNLVCKELDRAYEMVCVFLISLPCL